MKKGLFLCIGKLDIKNWSGTTYNLYEALKNESTFNLDICELKENIILKILVKIKDKILRQNYSYSRHTIVNKLYANKIKKVIKKEKYNFIFSIGTLPISSLETDIPIYVYTDGTVSLMKNYYIREAERISHKSEEKIEKLEQNAIEKAKKMFVASDWCRQSVIKDYGKKEPDVITVKIGANMVNNKKEKDILDNICKKAYNKNINLLFVGVDWFRKGGEKALKILDELTNRGKKAKLTIVGCQPLIDERKNVQIYKFLDKNQEKDRKQLEELYEETDFLLLPTKAECVGVVFCEASSYRSAKYLS